MGKGRGKFKRRYSTTRQGPSKAQKDYIDRVSNPTSPEDLILALQNPATPAYKQMMNLIAARMEINAIIETLIQRHLIEQYQASQKEKDEIFKELLAKELADQKEARRFYELQTSLPVKTPVVEQEVLKEKIIAGTQKVESLRNEISKIKDEIAELDEKSKDNNRQWQETTRQQRQDFIDRLAANNIPIMSSSGKVIGMADPRVRAFLEEPPPDVGKVISIVSASHALQEMKMRPMEAPKKEVEIDPKTGIPIPPSSPLPPPPPPPVKHPLFEAKSMAVHSCLLEHIRFLAGARDNPDSIQDMFNAMKNNKEASELFFPGAKVVFIKMPEGTKRVGDNEDKGLKARTEIIDRELGIHEKKMDRQDDLMKKQVELKQEELKLNNNVKVYEQNYGKLHSEESQRKEESYSPPTSSTPKSTG